MLNNVNNAYNTNNANNGHKDASGDIQTRACMLYALYAWADAYNSVVNVYNAHDTAGSSWLDSHCAC